MSIMIESIEVTFCGAKMDEKEGIDDTDSKASV